MTSLWVSKLRLAALLFILEAAFIILFAFTADYDATARPQLSIHTHGNHSEQRDGQVSQYYPMFQDVHVMIFIGFGFLMTFLRRYGYSSVGVNMLLAAVAIQWAILVSGYLHGHGLKVRISITSLLTADFASAAVLITFGALLGKTSPLQMAIICVFEIVLFAVNEWIGLVIFQAVDVGGSMFVHAFGAYFGLATARVLYKDDVTKSSKENAVYHSDLFAMIGTIFLWLFWPSFNSALAVDDAQDRAVINTYLSLAACCVITFAMSALTHSHGKFDMVHIQNATLAGGVAVGTSADMLIGPHGALLIGCIAGTLSVTGYKYVTPFLMSRLKVHDTCGVNNLHGMPAILAAVAGSIATLMASEDTYGYTLYRQFPARVPANDSSENYLRLAKHAVIFPGLDRTASEQAGYQMAALAVTLIIAITGGLIVGLIVRMIPSGRPRGDKLFEDDVNWHVPEDLAISQRTQEGGVLLMTSQEQSKLEIETNIN